MLCSALIAYSTMSLDFADNTEVVQLAKIELPLITDPLFSELCLSTDHLVDNTLRGIIYMD